MATTRRGFRTGAMFSFFFCSVVSATFISGSRLTPEDVTLTSQKLKVLSEVLRGPARSRPVVLHLDPAALPLRVVGAALTLEAVVSTPHLTFTLGASHHWLSDLRMHDSSTLHLVLFLTLQPQLLRSLWQHWKPQNLLLFSLQSAGSVDILREESLSGVERLALIADLRREEGEKSQSAGVYTLFPLSSCRPQLLAEWEPRVFPEWEMIFPDRFPTFNGHNLRAAAWLFAWPYIFEGESGASEPVAGVSVKMLKALSVPLNFSIQFILADNYGIKRNNSSANVLDLVRDRAVNLSCNPFLLNEQLFDDFDISPPFYEDGYSAFLAKTDPTPGWAGLIQPFSPLVWAAVGASVAAVVGLFMVQRWVGQPPLGGAGASCLCVVRGLLGQSVPVLPHPLRQKVFLVGWYIWCFVLTAAYTTNLAALLTTPASPLRPRTLQQLADSHYRLAMEDYGTWVPELLRQSEEPVSRKLGEKLDLFPSMTEALAAMLAGTHAVFDTTIFTLGTIGPYFEVYNSTRIEEELFRGHASWVFPRHTPWKDKFDRGLIRMVSAGLIHHWYQEEREQLRVKNMEKEKNSTEAQRTDLPLSLRHLAVIFVVLALAWFIGGVILVLEILRNHCMKMRLS